MSKKTIKTLVAVLMLFVMVLCLGACENGSQNGPSGTQVNETQNSAGKNETLAEQEVEPADSGATSENAADAASTGENNEDSSTHSEILVAYFSATGTTKTVAEKIASVTGADMYEILAAQPYSADDLNYNDRTTRATREQDDKNVRPEIGSEDLSLEGYTTMYLGFPIWWGEEPRILDTFVEKYSFEGITVIPFCTSGSSGIGRSGPNMEALAGSGTWLQGRRFSESVSEADIQSWIDGLK